MFSPCCSASQRASVLQRDRLLLPAALSKIASLDVEDSPLLVKYPSPLGGRQIEGHLRNQVEAVLIAHRVPQEKGKNFTINKRINVDDVHGQNRGFGSAVLQQMEEPNYPPGVANGGPRCSLPKRALNFLINRRENVCRRDSHEFFLWLLSCALLTAPSLAHFLTVQIASAKTSLLVTGTGTRRIMYPLEQISIL